jgi:hypothetical protein
MMVAELLDKAMVCPCIVGMARVELWLCLTADNIHLLRLPNPLTKDMYKGDEGE